jgi:hypothetical protein
MRALHTSGRTIHRHPTPFGPSFVLLWDFTPHVSQKVGTIIGSYSVRLGPSCMSLRCPKQWGGGVRKILYRCTRKARPPPSPPPSCVEELETDGNWQKVTKHLVLGWAGLLCAIGVYTLQQVVLGDSKQQTHDNAHCRPHTPVYVPVARPSGPQSAQAGAIHAPGKAQCSHHNPINRSGLGAKRCQHTPPLPAVSGNAPKYNKRKPLSKRGKTVADVASWDRLAPMPLSRPPLPELPTSKLKWIAHPSVQQASGCAGTDSQAQHFCGAVEKAQLMLAEASVERDVVGHGNDKAQSTPKPIPRPASANPKRFAGPTRRSVGTQTWHERGTQTDENLGSGSCKPGWSMLIPTTTLEAQQDHTSGVQLQEQQQAGLLASPDISCGLQELEHLVQVQQEQVRSKALYASLERPVPMGFVSHMRMAPQRPRRVQVQCAAGLS